MLVDDLAIIYGELMGFNHQTHAHMAVESSGKSQSVEGLAPIHLIPLRVSQFMEELYSLHGHAFSFGKR